MKEDVMKAAGGDVAAYLSNALKAQRMLQSPSV